MILNDWLRGKIPYFNPPPESSEPPQNDDKKINEKDKPKVVTPQQKISSIRVRDEFYDHSKKLDPDDFGSSEEIDVENDEENDEEVPLLVPVNSTNQMENNEDDKNDEENDEEINEEKNEDQLDWEDVVDTVEWKPKK